MFKYLNLCIFALTTVASAKPSIIAPLATYPTSLVSAPLTAGYTLPYVAYVTGPYAGAFEAYSPYSSYSSYLPYYAAYSSYPYGSLLLRK